jgi:TrmH family RNA methyltransferase
VCSSDLYASPAFLLVGNEAQGLPADYEAQCDLLVKMPMLGKADSLNAAVATAVMAYEVLNQRRAR